MATTVSQHQQTEFTDPQNGNSPIDASEVTANDNALRTAYNAHDADTGVHVQSSVLGSRPAAGTSGRKWISVDSLSAPTAVRLWYDDGSTWYEADYMSNAGGTMAGSLNITNTTTQLLVSYDGTYRMAVAVASNGDTTLSGNIGADLIMSSWASLTIPGGLISYGANDSGGAGFRTVLVPNV